MTTLDELQRVEPEAVEYLRLRLADESGYINTPDIEAIHKILSERSELLATVERMRVALERIADPRNIHFAGDAQVVARAALTTGEKK